MGLCLPCVSVAPLFVSGSSGQHIHARWLGAPVILDWGAAPYEESTPLLSPDEGYRRRRDVSKLHRARVMWKQVMMMKDLL